jgi:hypothetical protein
MIKKEKTMQFVFLKINGECTNMNDLKKLNLEKNFVQYYYFVHYYSKSFFFFFFLIQNNSIYPAIKNISKRNY